MRVSIWQQFSSNHSSQFTVVGQFPSAELAEEIARRFWPWLEAVGQWIAKRDAAMTEANKLETTHEKREEHYQELFPDAENKLDELKHEFAQHFGIELKGIDWVAGEYAPKELVQVLGRYVIVMSNTWETWERPEPFESLLVQWGAEVTFGELDQPYIGVSLTFHAPFEDTAIQIYNVIQTHLDFIEAANKGQRAWHEKVRLQRPWKPFEPGQDYRFEYDLDAGRKLQRNSVEISCELLFRRIGYALPAFVAWLESL